MSMGAETPSGSTLAVGLVAPGSAAKVAQDGVKHRNNFERHDNIKLLSSAQLQAPTQGSMTCLEARGSNMLYPIAKLGCTPMAIR